MRLLILTQYYPPEIGAAQTRLCALTRALVTRGHVVEVVTAMPNHLAPRTFEGYRGRLYMRETLDGAAVHRTWVYPATGTGLRRMMNYLSFTCTSFIGLARAKRPDAVFVESPPLFLSVPGWIAATVWRAPLIFNVADLWPDAVREFGVIRDGPFLAAAERLESWAYRRATTVNAITESMRAELRERKGVPATKLRFLPNGVDVERLQPRERSTALAARLGLDARPVFLYVGTHGIAHALHVLVGAAALVPQAQVVFVGGGTTKAALRELARNVENVRFVDPVPLDELPDYFSLACASVVPLTRSRHNHGARPAKLFSSLACGVPVIYSGDGEGAGIVQDARAGIVVAPEDPRAIAQAMLRLMDDPIERGQMSQRARALAVERFAWSKIVDGWLASL
ncbi:MAG TPA: glycosyltransferase family 4 protein [Candidatus Acidoferrales bacterium]|nr:glycosyltransferase family 4 protein [Candidatus Acidoferrales bacterium]